MAPRKHAGRLFGFVMNTDVRLNVDFEKTPQIPKIKLRVERSDNVFVLKVKIECALRLLQFRDEALREVTAEDIYLEYRGVPMRDMMAVEKYSLKVSAKRPWRREQAPRRTDARCERVDRMARRSRRS